MDIAFFRWINTHHCRALDYLMWWASSTVDFNLIWLLIGLAAWALDRDKGKETLLGILIALACACLSVDLLLKPLVARSRPFLALDGVRLIRNTPSLRAFRSTW